MTIIGLRDGSRARSSSFMRSRAMLTQAWVGP